MFFLTPQHLVLHLDASCWISASKELLKVAREEFNKSWRLMDLVCHQFDTTTKNDNYISEQKIRTVPDPVLESNLDPESKIVVEVMTKLKAPSLALFGHWKPLTSISHL